MNPSDSQRHSDSSRQKEEFPIQPNEDVDSEPNIPNHLSVSDILRTLLQESQHDYNSDSGSDLYTPESTDSPATYAEELFIGRDYEIEDEIPPLIDGKTEDDQEAYSQPKFSPPFPSPSHPSTLPPTRVRRNSASAARERPAAAQTPISHSPDSDTHSNHSEEDIPSNDDSGAETDLASYNDRDEGGGEDVGIDEDYSDPFMGLEIVDEGRGRHQLSVVELVRRFRELVGERWGDVWEGR